MGSKYFSRMALGLALAAICSAPTHAQQTYPSRAISLVVTNAPGSANDTTTRFIADRLSKILSVPAVVENKPGAGGVVATEYVAKQPADGYTVLMTGSIHYVNYALYKELPFDSIKDFRQIAKAVDAPLALVVPANSPFNSLQDLVNYMRENPGKLNYASSGNGTTPHMAGALLMHVAKTKATHIPYKRGDQAIADTVGGHYDMIFSALPPILGLVSTGKLKALAVTGPERSESLPDVPTIQELGYPQFDLIPHVGMMARADVPDEAIKVLSNALAEVLTSDEFKKYAVSNGMIPAFLNAEQYTEASKQYFKSWDHVVAVSGAKLD